MWTLQRTDSKKPETISTNAAKLLLGKEYKAQVVPVVMNKMKTEGKVERVATGNLWWA